ncbi:MAG: ABC transporter ATP-binding protein [Clostridia bacterium]
MEIIKINELCAKYSKKAEYAVSNISFSVQSGEVVGLLGSNGAGKSTTLKCLTGMLEPTSGTVHVCGYNIKSEPLKAKQNFAFVTDNHSVFTKMTGWQYLNFMADVYGVSVDDRKSVYEMLEKSFRLGDSVNNLISSYSHGMKQKICMMGSLIHSPKLWILDEPMLGLDPSTMSSVMILMQNYAKQGNTILFSSHNLDTVKRLCDRVLVIKKGELIADINMTEAISENANFNLSDYLHLDDEECEEVIS